jgi:hypothetical protein
MSTHEADLNLPNWNLPPEALTAHLFPDLQHSLLSIGTLCNHGCTALFNANNVIIRRNGQQLSLAIAIQPTNSGISTWHNQTSNPPTQHHLLHSVPTLPLQPPVTLYNFFMPPASAQSSQRLSKPSTMVTLQPGKVSLQLTFNVSCQNPLLLSKAI